MKKFLGLAAALLFTAFSYAQATVSFSDATADYDKTATTSFNFMFSPIHTAEDIKSNAAYYESYFLVTVESAGSAGNKVNIALVEDNEMARRVIMRLLVNLDIDAINVNGTEMERNDFMTKYIMTE